MRESGEDRRRAPDHAQRPAVIGYLVAVDLVDDLGCGRIAARRMAANTDDLRNAHRAVFGC